MSETTATNTDIWNPLGEQRWRELAEGTGASELQLKFAAARFGGASATRAAALAGYSGDGAALRRAGYTAVRSTAVQNLLELGSIAAPADARISNKEIDAKISKMIRSSDSNVSLKAMEVFAKREAARKEEAESNKQDLPVEVVILNEARGLLGCGLGGLLHVAAMHLGIIGYYGPRISFTALPLFAELAPNFKAEYPEVWQHILNSLDADCRKEAEKLALAAPGDVSTLMELPKVVAHATE